MTKKINSTKNINTPRPSSQELRQAEGKFTPLSKLSTQVNTGKRQPKKSYGSLFKQPISRFQGSLLTVSSNKNKQFSSVSRKASCEKSHEMLFASKQKSTGLYASVNRNARFHGKTPSQGQTAKMASQQRPEDSVLASPDQNEHESEAQPVQIKSAKMSDHFENINLKEALPEDESQKIRFEEDKKVSEKRANKKRVRSPKSTKMSLKQLSKEMSKVRYKTSLRASPKPARIKSCFDFSPKRFLNKTRGSLSGMDFTLRSQRGFGKGLSIQTQQSRRKGPLGATVRNSFGGKKSRLEGFLSHTYKSESQRRGPGSDGRRLLQGKKGRRKSPSQVNLYSGKFGKKKKSVFAKKTRQKETQAEREVVSGDETAQAEQRRREARNASEEKTGRSNISNVNINQININNINTIDQEFYRKCKENLIHNISEIIMKSSKELTKKAPQFQSRDCAEGHSPGKLKGEIDLVALKNNICKEFENSLRFRSGAHAGPKDNLFLGILRDQVRTGAKPECKVYPAEAVARTEEAFPTQSHAKQSSTSQKPQRGDDSRTEHAFNDVIIRKTHGTGEFTRSINKSKMASISEIIGQFESDNFSKIKNCSPIHPKSFKIRRVGTLKTELKNQAGLSQERRTRTNLQEKAQTKSPASELKQQLGLNKEKVREINRKLFTQDPQSSTRRIAKDKLLLRSKVNLTDKFGPAKNVELRSYDKDRIWETETGTVAEQTEPKPKMSELDIFITDIHKRSLKRIEEVGQVPEPKTTRQPKQVRSLQISANKMDHNELNEKVFYLRKNLSNKKAPNPKNPVRKFCLLSLMEDQMAAGHSQSPNLFDGSFSSGNAPTKSGQQVDAGRSPGALGKAKWTGGEKGVRCLTQRKMALQEFKNSKNLIQLFDISHLDNLTTQFFISKFTLVLQIYCLVEKKGDFYAPLKSLSKMIQQPMLEEVMLVFRTVNSPNPLFCNFSSDMMTVLQKDPSSSQPFPRARIERLKKCLTRCFELETISVLLLFYLFVEGKNHFKMLRILELVAHNCFVFLWLLKRVFGELEWKPRETLIDHFLSASNAVNAFKTVQDDVSLNFEKNNKIVVTQIQILLANHAKLRNGLSPFLATHGAGRGLKQTIEDVFRIFYDLLAEKGLITMSGSKNKDSSETEQEPASDTKTANLKSVLSKKKRSFVVSPEKPSVAPQEPRPEAPLEQKSAMELEKQRQEICFGASRELKNILSQSEVPRQRTLNDYSRTDKRNESILLTGKEKRQLDVERSREMSREHVPDSAGEGKSGLVNTSMKVMNLSKNLSITDSVGRHSELLGISVANNKNSAFNGKPDQNCLR